MKDIILLIFILAGFPFGTFLINGAHDFLRHGRRKMNERCGVISSKSITTVKAYEVSEKVKKDLTQDDAKPKTSVFDIENEYWGHAVWYPIISVKGKESVMSYSHR